jgi:DNA-binding NarL/FixJ family response regulator
MADVDVTACLLWRDLSPAMFEHVLALILQARFRFGSEAVAEAFVSSRESSFTTTSLPLSPRQRDVLNLIAAGMTNQEIANRLRISPNTVGSHIQRMKDHLGATSRADLISVALRHGLPER